MTVERRGPRRAIAPASPRAEHAPQEDTALRSLSKEDRAKLGMDAWEPSLLRQLLAAHNKPTNQNKS
jgi:hypothetical protein